MSGTKVVSTDLSTGQTSESLIVDDYVLVTDGRCELVHASMVGNGIHVLTIKRPRESLS